jgi:hypothetical protein
MGKGFPDFFQAVVGEAADNGRRRVMTVGAARAFRVVTAAAVLCGSRLAPADNSPPAGPVAPSAVESIAEAPLAPMDGRPRCERGACPKIELGRLPDGAPFDELRVIPNQAPESWELALHAKGAWWRLGETGLHTNNRGRGDPGVLDAAGSRGPAGRG